MSTVSVRTLCYLIEHRAGEGGVMWRHGKLACNCTAVGAKKHSMSSGCMELIWLAEQHKLHSVTGDSEQRSSTNFTP